MPPEEVSAIWQGNKVMRDSDVSWVAVLQLCPGADDIPPAGMPVITPESIGAAQKEVAPICEISIIPLRHAKQPIQLNMVEDAVDDMYFDCNARMADMVNKKYFRKENKGKFGDVWKKAKTCAKNRFTEKDKEDKALTINHIQAICVYTGNDAGKDKNFYQEFNDAVRTKRKKYCTSFPFHSLHFWLTSAIQILNKNKNCSTTYRRTNVVFTGKVNQIVRFGTFASSSLSSNMTQFGNKTCFKITTCFGAFLKKYPRLKDIEQEVLIPPYEMFKITETISVENVSDCERVYILESAGVQSNLDCFAFK
ncbi:ecto-ADP-ribosyltransferase 4-like [Seriola aureovittata]|uniref:ecto-ADP-ribosyltransferase 4-like n=1 Tax=Seriola aureovittata TaxID=2871759 RepID=UPI0024BE8975|nr:ecto-ADP-ribosyltransferase 4-like [Seriola aureovittata]